MRRFLCISLALTALMLLSVPSARAYQSVDSSGCLTCHTAGPPGGDEGLHGVGSHTNCGACHDGGPSAGNVGSSACIVCHPLGDPGKCALILLSAHGSTCSGCHPTCEEDDVTPSTTTIATRPCLAEQIYGESAEEVYILRRFRDEVLSLSPAGQSLIEAYYRLSAELCDAVQSSARLEKLIKSQADAAIPLFRAWLEMD